MKAGLTAAVAASCAPLVLMVRDASALGPVDVEVAALGSYGTNPSTTSATNPLAFGVGARAGASMFGVYAGAEVAYSFGSGSSLLYDARYNDRLTQHAVKIGGEVGYSFRVAFLTIRPRLGAGDLLVSTAATKLGPPCPCDMIVFAPPVPSTQSDLYLEGAVGAFTPIPGLDAVFVGLDAEFLVLPNPMYGECCDELETAFTFDAEVGLKF
jgi:hypothetical protein